MRLPRCKGADSPFLLLAPALTALLSDLRQLAPPCRLGIVHTRVCRRIHQQIKLQSLKRRFYSVRLRQIQLRP